MGSLVDFQRTNGPDAVSHYNVYPAIEKMERICREHLPSSFRSSGPNSLLYALEDEIGGEKFLQTRQGTASYQQKALTISKSSASRVKTTDSMTPSSPIEAKRAGRTILVVDDEPSILNCVRRVLEHANYNVITSPSGNQAWEIVEQGRPKIDVVLTDIVMPGSIDGLTLAAKIRRREPNLQLLFMTGALPEDEESAAQLVKKRLLLRKPFFPKQLVEFVDSHFFRD